MSDRINLQDRAKDMIGEQIAYDMKTLDIDTLRDGIGDAAHSEADNACIYTHACFQILSDYENHSAAPSESEMGGTYRADQYNEAATAWAYEVASAVLSAEASEIIDKIESEADDFCDVINKHLGDNDHVSPDDLAVSRDCPHGWAAHDREETMGERSVLLWLSGQVDGLRALAVDVGPFWLSYTWDARPVADVPASPDAGATE